MEVGRSVSSQYETYHQIVRDMAADGVAAGRAGQPGGEADPERAVREAFIRAFRDEVSDNDKRGRQ